MVFPGWENPGKWDPILPLYIPEPVILKTWGWLCLWVRKYIFLSVENKCKNKKVGLLMTGTLAWTV